MTALLTPSRQHPLRARLLPLARIGWLVVVSLALLQWLVTLPTLFRALQRPCTSVAECDLPGSLPAESLPALAAADITPRAWAIYMVVLFSAVIVVWLAVALAIFFYRANDPGVLLIALLLALINPVTYNGHTEVLVSHHSVWLGLVAAETFVSSIIYAALFLLFPNGRFVPRWTRWVMLAAVAQAALVLSVSESTPNTSAAGLVALASTVINLAGTAVVIYAQVYRYRRVSSARERQQTKWAVFGLVVASIGLIVLSVGAGSMDSNPVSLALLYTLYALVQLCIPITIGIAILRFRLYDIDLIINRTLVYGSLTALLAGVYFGSVLVMQHLAIAFAGTDAGANPLILVVSTLLIAALFQPLRHRLQRTIDRRFYRQKYDAAKTLDRFAATLRGEVELADLEGHLVGVVEETMQPAHVSLWLRVDESGREHIR